METVEMTREGFEIALAEAQEPKPTTHGDVWGPDLSPKRVWGWHRDNWHPYDSPTRRINRSMELIKAMPITGMHKGRFTVKVQWRISWKETEKVLYGQPDYALELAISLGWYEYWTGTRVTLIEDSP